MSSIFVLLEKLLCDSLIRKEIILDPSDLEYLTSGKGARLCGDACARVESCGTKSCFHSRRHGTDTSSGVGSDRVTPYKVDIGGF